MNRKLLVTLLHKNLEELNVITEGFMEMEEYPAAIIHLAKRKTEDIQIIIDQLSEEKGEQFIHTMPYINVHQEPVSGNTESLKPAETELMDAQEIISKDKTALEALEIASLQEEVEMFEPEIIIPVVENLEKDLNPELNIEDTEIENFTEIVVEPKLKEAPEVLVEKVEESSIIEEVYEIKSTSITSIDEIEKKTTTEEHKRTIIAEKIIPPTVSRNETLAKEDHSLSASIANKKITDIKQAISIGDRFRFQRELFKGNGEEMNRTLNYINQLATFDEASSFLVLKYGWDKANDSVEDFLQIVRRRF